MKNVWMPNDKKSHVGKEGKKAKVKRKLCTKNEENISRHTKINIVYKVTILSCQTIPKQTRIRENAYTLVP
jgi:cell division protein FtsL